MPPERVSKIISACGVSSRREAESLIIAGRVTVRGVPAVLGQKAEQGVDEIAIDGVPLARSGEYVYIMLNKPRGYVTTMSDEHGRNTIVSLVEQLGIRVYPVGRLDMDSEGLLLMTNDGAFANAVAHPSGNLAKTYEARVRGDINAAASRMRLPMDIGPHRVCALSVEVLEQSTGGGTLSVAIAEGRNRQVRKMCALCGLTVVALKRVSIGDLELGELGTGRWRHLTQEEREGLTEQ